MALKKNDFEHYFTKKPKSELQLFDISLLIFNKRYHFHSASGIFSHKKVDRGSILLLKNFLAPENKNPLILDLGCGYGILGIVIADLIPNSHVILTDINERATWLTKKNLVKNNIKNAEIRKGIFFEPVKDLKFDSIITNPPISIGKSILFDVFEQSKQFLKPNGTIQTVIRTKQGAKSYFHKLHDIFGEKNVSLLDIKSGYRVFIARKI